MRHFVIALLVVAPATASAQEEIDLQLFFPSPGAHNYFTVESGDVNSHLDVSVGLNLNYARNPLAVQILEDEGATRPVGTIVGYRVDAVLLAALGLFDMGEIGLAMPLILQGGQEGGALNSAGVDAGGTLSSFATGDLRILPKVRFLHLHDGMLSAALFGEIVIPTGGQGWASEGSLNGSAWLALSTRTSFVRAALDLGYRIRERTRVEPVPSQILLTVDDEVVFKAAVAFDVTMGSDAPFEIVGELIGRTPTSNAFAWNAQTEEAKKKQWARSSLEGDVGIRWILAEHFILTGGVGFGLLPQGYGQPVPRVFAGFGWYSGTFGIADADKDGVPDAVDECPKKKEDRDGFEDTDGCPDTDNDDDNVLDEDDQCPMDPEDKDGLADQDGCPETDVDEDGVLDEVDQCQGDVEDKDGFEDEDGCADLDNDGDTIADKVDECPMEAEDVDGFEDVNGCPDTDNDNDGLPDLGDMCPNHAEDMDGVADDDGCPEDNDGDGIPDDLDKCPNKAEIYNGVDDEDGCPEKLRVRSLVTVTEDKIEIKETVYFRTGSADIMKKSNKLLDQVASVLKNYKHISKVRIEGHTDSRGARKRNTQLSQDRAESVRQYLIANGVAENRLEAVGYGPDKPIASNRNRRGREQNRRVEFVIAEQKPIGVDVSGGPEPEAVEMDMEGIGGEETGEGGDIEMEMDFGGPEPAPEPEKPDPDSADALFEDDTPVEEPPPPPVEEEEPEKAKGKRKGKKKKKKKKEEEPEIEFEF